MKYLETEEKKIICNHISYFVILFVLFYLGLTSLDPPENGIAINFGTTEFGSGNVQPTEPIQCTSKQLQQTAASNQDILSQDIEEAVDKTNQKTQPSKETAKEEVKPKPKENPQKAPLMHCQAS
jgi:hypothetical protein